MTSGGDAGGMVRGETKRCCWWLDFKFEMIF